MNLTPTTINMESVHYIANITAGGLMVPQSRKIAQLLLTYPDKVRWKEVIERQNILQQRTTSSAARIASFIKARLELMTPELWTLIAEGDSVISTHAVFACAIKHCRLLGDFLDLVVRDSLRRYEDKLTHRLWDDFIEGCKQRDPQMPEFPPTTAAKMESNIFKILFEAGYLKKRKTLELQRVIITHEVMDYLKNNNEDYVLKCIQV